MKTLTINQSSKCLKWLMCVLTFSILANQCFTQNIRAVNDTFILRADTPIDYNLPVLNNDSNPSGTARIIRVNPIGGSAGQYTIFPSTDSLTVRIQNQTSGSFAGQFIYHIRDNVSGSFDSTEVNFTLQTLPRAVYPGDCNNDSIVNHFDIFPIGLHFGRAGSPRHNLDTSSNFIPRAAGDWFHSIGNVNAKYADINGSGRINDDDMKALPINLGRSRGTYIPRRSDTNTTSNFAFFEVPSDTIAVHPDSILRIPIAKSIASPFYGLGYTIQMLVRNNSTGQDTIFQKFQLTKSDFWDLKKSLSIKDTVSKPMQKSLAYVRTDKVNTDDDIGPLGVVEIVVIEILIGLRDPKDIVRLQLDMIDAAMINNQNVLIPFKPARRTLYLRNSQARAGVSNSGMSYRIYPNPSHDYVMIERTEAQQTDYKIYNAVGQVVISGQLMTKHSKVNIDQLPDGLYYLKIDQSPEISYKIIKQGN